MTSKRLLLILLGSNGVLAAAVLWLLLERAPLTSLPAAPAQISAGSALPVSLAPSAPLAARHDQPRSSVRTTSSATPAAGRSSQSLVPAQISSVAAAASGQRQQPSVSRIPPSGRPQSAVTFSDVATVSGAPSVYGRGPVTRAPLPALTGAQASSAPQFFSHPVAGQTFPAGDSGSAGASEQPATFTSSDSAATEPPLLTPAALAPQDETIPITTEQQVVEWEKLQEDFITEIGGEQQDLSDPSAQSRWTEAQLESDEKFRAKFGWQAFLQQNILAGRQAVGQ